MPINGSLKPSLIGESCCGWISKQTGANAVHVNLLLERMFKRSPWPLDLGLQPFEIPAEVYGSKIFCRPKWICVSVRKRKDNKSRDYKALTGITLRNWKLSSKDDPVEVSRRLNTVSFILNNSTQMDTLDNVLTIIILSDGSMTLLIKYDLHKTTSFKTSEMLESCI